MAIVSELLVQVGADVGGAERGLASVNRGVDSLARGAQAAGAPFNAFTQLATGAMQQIGSLAINAGVELGRLAVGGLGAATEAGMEFERTMSGVQAVLSPTTEEMNALSAAALRIGKDTSFGAGDAAAAIEMLAKNGLSATEILDGAADATIALAAATGLDGAGLATAADIATNAMSVFGIEAANMSEAINGITSVTVASQFGIDDYKLALAQAGGTAATVGVEFDDFNASIAAISPLFASGSDAGTSFKTMLQRLVPASGPAAEAMAKLGILAEDGSNKFFDAQGNLKSMAEVAGVMQEALSGLSEEAAIDLFTTAFGTDAQRAAFALAQTGAEDFKALAASMQEVDAAAQAATRLDNLTGDLEGLKGALETVGIEAFTAFNPLLREATQGLSAFVDGFVGFDYAPLVNAVSSIANVFSTTARYIELGVPPLGAFSAALKLSTQDAGPFIQYLVEATTTFTSFAAALVRGDLFTVYEDGSNAIGSLIELFGIAEVTAQRFGAAISGAAVGIAGIFEGISTGNITISTLIDRAIQSVQEQLPGWQAAFMPYVDSAGNWIMQAAERLPGNLATWGAQLTNYVTANLPGWVDALRPYAETAANWILDGASFLATNVLEWRNQLVGYVLENLPGWMDALAPYAAALGQWVLDAIPGLLENLTTATVDLINIIGQNLPGVIDKLGEWALAFAQWVVDAAPGLLANLGTAIGQILDALGANLPGIIEKLAEWGGKFIEWIIDATPGLLLELGGLANAMLAWIVERIPGITETLGSWIGAFVEWVIPATADLIGNLGTLFGQLLTWALERSPEINAQLGEWATQFGAWVMEDAWPATLEKLGEWWEAFKGWLRDRITAIGAEGSIGRAIWDSLFGGGGDQPTGDGAPIPGFANGVRNFGGGLALVGERGPELVNLPRGSSVFSNGDSAAMLAGGAGAASNINVTVVVQGSVQTEQDLAETIRQRFIDISRQGNLGF